MCVQPAINVSNAVPGSGRPQQRQASTRDDCAAAIPGSSVKPMTQGFVRASRILQKKHAESRYGMEVKYAWVKAAQATKATAKNPSPAKLAAAPIAGRSQRARMACCASAMAPSISAPWITASPPK
jgi:hypothetical protein